MLRKITKAFGRYKEGEQHDYPIAIWRRFEKELRTPMDKFSVEVPNPILQNPLKGPVTIHKRLGSTA